MNTEDKVLKYSTILLSLLRSFGMEETLTISVENVIQIVSSHTLLDLLKSSSQEVTDNIKKVVQQDKDDQHAISEEVHKHFTQEEIDREFAEHFREYTKSLVDKVRDQLDADKIEEIEKVLKEIEDITQEDIVASQ